jgi:predicted HicB family RNase H-like nuclease
MTKRIQIVARIEPDLRRMVARVARRQKTTLNALIETALRAYIEGLDSAGASKPSAKESQ